MGSVLIFIHHCIATNQPNPVLCLTISVIFIAVMLRDQGWTLDSVMTVSEFHSETAHYDI